MKNLGIEAFLAKPFQRLCRYPLYLGRLLELHGAQVCRHQAHALEGGLPVVVGTGSNYVVPNMPLNAVY